MINSKYFASFVIIMLLTRCVSKPAFNIALLKQYAGPIREGVIISCTRCGCIDKTMKTFKRTRKGIAILADTSCFSGMEYDVNFLSQDRLDSIFPRNYNIILFRWNSKGRFFYRLIETREAYDLADISERFFD